MTKQEILIILNSNDIYALLFQYYLDTKENASLTYQAFCEQMHSFCNVNILIGMNLQTAVHRISDHYIKTFGIMWCNYNNTTYFF